MPTAQRLTIELMSNSLAVSASSRVRLNFAIKLTDGSVVDSNFDQPACEFVYGDGSLLPGFEACLLGLKAGARTEFEIPAENAFGNRDEDKELPFKRETLADYDLEPGLVLSFADPSGERPGVVKHIGDEQVLVDFNHPLAGQTLLFEVLIHAVENVND